MSQLLVPAKLYAREGVDVILNTKNNPQLRDLGVELLGFGIKAMDGEEAMSETDQQLFQQYREYYDVVCKQWNYVCNQKGLEEEWKCMTDFCFDTYKKMLECHQKQSDLLLLLQRIYIYLSFKRETSKLQYDEDLRFSWASGVISSYKSSGEYDSTSFEEWKKEFERVKAGHGDDLNRMPPDVDLNLNRMPPDIDDLNLNRMPPDDDLNLNRMPPDVDDLNLNRMPPNDDDLNLNRMPPDIDDLNLNRMPPDIDDLNLNRMPPSISSHSLNSTPSCPVSPPVIPPIPSSALPQLTSSAGESQTQPSPPCPDFIKDPNFVPKCPKVQDLNKEKHSPGSMPSLPKVQPLSESVTDHRSSHTSSLPSPPVVNSMPLRDPPSTLGYNSSDSMSAAPNVAFPGPPSLPASLGTPVMASPSPVSVVGSGFYSPQSSFQAPMYSGTHLSTADVQTCTSKLLTVSSNLSRYCQLYPDFYLYIRELEDVRRMILGQRQ